MSEPLAPVTWRKPSQPSPPTVIGSVVARRPRRSTTASGLFRVLLCLGWEVDVFLRILEPPTNSWRRAIATAEARMGTPRLSRPAETRSCWGHRPRRVHAGGKTGDGQHTPRRGGGDPRGCSDGVLKGRCADRPGAGLIAIDPRAVRWRSNGLIAPRQRARSGASSLGVRAPRAEREKTPAGSAPRASWTPQLASQRRTASPRQLFGAALARKGTGLAVSARQPRACIVARTAGSFHLEATPT
jgi:hypothetical protein